MRLARYDKVMKFVVRPIVGALLLFVAQQAFAEVDDLESMMTRLHEQVISVAGFLSIVSYVAGVGFCLAGIIQFKAHKDNPAQVPLSKPIVYLAVGAALLFLPSMMKIAGSTVFGDNMSSAASADAKSLTGT